MELKCWLLTWGASQDALSQRPIEMMPGGSALNTGGHLTRSVISQVAVGGTRLDQLMTFLVVTRAFFQKTVHHLD
jgi:hypothetical protein